MRTIAYLSMEVALDPAMPTFAGGLGILAGDTIRSAADLEVPMVAVSLLPRHGYLKQHIDTSGWQHSDPCERIREDTLDRQIARYLDPR